MRRFFKHDWHDTHPAMLYAEVDGVRYRHGKGTGWQVYVHVPNPDVLTEVNQEECAALIIKRNQGKETTNEL